MEKIVSEVLAGKKGSATRLYREYSPGLKRYLVSKLPTNADAQELLQEVFISAFDSLPLFAGQSSLKTWIYSIARHEVADFYRKRYVRKAIEVTGQLYEGIAVEMGTPEFEMKKNLIRERYEKAMRGLNDKYRKVIEYKYEMDLSVKEIAERMNMTFKATESLLYRARMAFIALYEEN